MLPLFSRTVFKNHSNQMALSKVQLVVPLMACFLLFTAQSEGKYFTYVSSHFILL